MVTGMPKTEVYFKIKYERYCVFSGVYLANKEVHIVEQTAGEVLLLDLVWHLELATPSTQKRTFN